MADGTDLEEASRSFVERFLILFCRFQFALYIIMVLEIMLLLLAIGSLLFATLDRGTQVVLLLDFVLLGVALTVTVGGIVVCSRR